MKRIKIIPLVFALLLALIVPVCMPNSVSTVQAASTAKISNSKLKLEVGKTKTLSIKGTKNKVTWSTSNKKVATVSKTGKVKAIAKGTATIKGTVVISKKKTVFSCKVTVTKNTLAKAKLLDITADVPDNFVTEDISEQLGLPTLCFLPKDTDIQSETGYSNITLTAIATGTPKLDYAEIEASMGAALSKEALEKQLATALQTTIKIKDFKQSDYDSKLGKSLKITLKFTAYDIEYSYAAYLLSIDNYLLQVTALEAPGKEKYNITALSEGILDSIKTN